MRKQWHPTDCHPPDTDVGGIVDQVVHVPLCTGIIRVRLRFLSSLLSLTKTEKRRKRFYNDNNNHTSKPFLSHATSNKRDSLAKDSLSWLVLWCTYKCQLLNTGQKTNKQTVCLIYEMLLIKELKPSWNIQSDSRSICAVIYITSNSKKCQVFSSTIYIFSFMIMSLSAW